MPSFTSSFKPVIAAAIAVLCIEAAVFAWVRPGLMERSNYLAWAYGKGEPFQKLLVHRKLVNVDQHARNIIQVGDSSGLHAIDPRIVDKYLGGLKYENLNCCVNTGYQGYYDIAEYALSRSTDVKALVLYTALTQVPQVGDRKAVGVLQDEVYNAVGSTWAQFSPPSQSLRPWMTDALYSVWGSIYPASRGTSPSDSVQGMLVEITQSRGWVREIDVRKTGENLSTYWNLACNRDPSLDLGAAENHALYFKRSWLGQEEFVPYETYERFAKLADRHGAKLIVVYQPYPCDALLGDSKSILHETFRKLRQQHPNVSVFPEQLVEHQPRSHFVSREHLRVGHDFEASHRLGRFMATAFNIKVDPTQIEAQPAASPTKTAAESATATNLIPAWNAPVGWLTAGINVNATSEPGTVMLQEDATASHYIEARPSGLVPGTSYLLSLEIKPVGPRVMKFAFRDKKAHGKYGTLDCLPHDETAARLGAVYDAGIDKLADGWFRCWASMVYTDTEAAVGIRMLTNEGAPYPGDGKSGILVRNLEFRPGLQLPAAKLDPDN